jgi:hypothetical protein
MPMIADLARNRPQRLFVIAALLAAFALGACTGETKHYEPRRVGDTRPQFEEPESIFGEGGLDLFGGPSQDQQQNQGGGIGVNSFLWRASLDTISFMPLVSADPFGGVIITDWYSPPQSPEERFKINVYILGRTLRADGVRAAVFRQRQSGAAGWVDAPVGSSTATELENAILTRARQLRIAQIGE